MLKYHNLLPILIAAMMLVACRVDAPASTPTISLTNEPATQPTAAPATAAPETTGLPKAVFYDLGETILVQANFPEDSRFRNMPARLNGVLAAPNAGDAPFPVVLILHGTHPGCPVNEAGVDAWPCDPDVERDNYAGFEYLVRELAARGYVALAVNINAQNTFGFGEPVGGERLEQIVDRHLSALAAAAGGGDNDFGLPLDGVADMSRLVLMGHSRGGEAANWLAGDFEGGPGFDSPSIYAERGYGPVNGLLLIAPAVAVIGTEGTHVPLAVIISGCDGDVTDGAGQLFYEEVRLGDAAINTPATSVVLDGANHNAFNTTLPRDSFGVPERPECEPLLEPASQRQFLVDFAADFLTTLYDDDPAARSAAAERLGQDVTDPAPSELLGYPAQLSTLAAGADRRPLFVPASAEELATNLLGGAVAADGLTTHFCEQGYSTPASNPGSEPCARPTVLVPGYPDMAVISWDGPGGALRFELPSGARDLSAYTTLSLRAAVDPLSSLNVPGKPQALSARLTDGAGRSAVVATRADEPALVFPTGTTREDEFFGTVFNGISPMTTIRVSLADFAGVNLADVTEIALLFDRTASGNLFLGDLELVRPAANDE